MSEAPPRDRQALYDRIARGGKDAVIAEEMVRLGFWTQNATLPEDPVAESQRIEQLTVELEKLRAQQRATTDIVRLEKAAKAARMKTSREKREQTKQRMLAMRAERKAAWRARQGTEIGYVGKGYSYGLGLPASQSSDEARLAALGLPLANNAAQLASLLGLSLRDVRYLTFTRDVSTISQYVRFTLPKKTGGVRLISAPRRRLKAAQHWVLGNILAKLTPTDHAHGFVASRSIVTNALPHVGAAVVINVDLKDFFPTVSYPRVRGLFAKLGYSQEVATLLALLCTEQDVTEAVLDGVTYFKKSGARRLPQGAPTSPALSNAICRRLDARLFGIATKMGFVFTRYADDLTFSSRDPQAAVGHLLAAVERFVEAEGFFVHPDKVRVLRKGRRQEVTGIVVNQQIGLAADKLKRFRAFLHTAKTKGLAVAKWDGIAGDDPHMRSRALGFSSYVAMVLPQRGAELTAAVRAIFA